MDASAARILDELKRKNFAPVYVLQGEETYYIDLISNYIETHTLTESERSFNQFVLYGREAPTNVILTHARRFPMMAERQVILVKEAQDIPDLQKEAGSKLMLDYLARPVPTTMLVLCHKHKTLDKRRELGKKIDQLAVSAAFKKPYDSQLPDFIVEYLHERGVEIQEPAIRILQEYVGNDLQRLANEMDKVLTGIDQTRILTAEKVMSQVGVSREYNVFELQKALITQDALLAAKIVAYFESNTKKNPAIPAVAFLYYFFSKLLMASSAIEKSEKGLVSLLKISPFAAKDYVRALQHYTTAKIIENVSLIKETDLKLKGVNTGADEGQILKELVFRLMV